MGLMKRTLQNCAPVWRAFADGWDSPEMAVYDDYAAAQARLKTRCCDPRAVPSI
jgi:hypothetical protein